MFKRQLLRAFAEFFEEHDFPASFIPEDNPLSTALQVYITDKKYANILLHQGEWVIQVYMHITEAMSDAPFPEGFTIKDTKPIDIGDPDSFDNLLSLLETERCAQL